MNESTPQQKIQHLVEKFHREEAAGAIAQYNESETKNGFIEPLLQSLGWNTQDRNEVGLEENVSGGRVDYSLRINGSTRIYIEAKPPRAKLTKTEVISEVCVYERDEAPIFYTVYEPAIKSIGKRILCMA